MGLDKVATLAYVTYMNRGQIEEIIAVLVDKYKELMAIDNLKLAEDIKKELEYWHKRLEDGGYF